MGAGPARAPVAESGRCCRPWLPPAAAAPSPRPPGKRLAGESLSGRGSRSGTQTQHSASPPLDAGPGPGPIEGAGFDGSHPPDQVFWLLGVY